MSVPYTPRDPYVSFRQVTTTADMAQDIRHDGGKASIINGDVFYSPNSVANVKLPPPVECNSKIWRNSKMSNPREFHQPLWWSEETAYLAFLPIYPQYCGEPFGELLEVPNYFDRVNRKYMLDPKILLNWKRLEIYLKRVADLLIAHSGAVPPKKVIDTALSCMGFYKFARYFRRSVKQSRDWFSVWMAEVSYAIAVATSSEDLPDQLNHIPEWCHYLLRQKDGQFPWWDQVYVSGIRQAMGSFSPSILRAGIFLQIVSPPQHQFSVDWFQRFHVPVWYPWSKKEIDAAKTSRHIQRLAPPPEKLQAIATFLSKEPENPVPDDDISTQTAVQQKPWVAFLAERAVRTKQAIECETPQQRQTRENRERQPPTRRVKVFVWEKDSDSESGYRREIVLQKQNEDTLGDYSDAQKVYNAVFNEWDCGEDFGDEKPGSDDGFEDDDDDSRNPYDMTAHFDHAGSASSPPISSSPPSSGPSSLMPLKTLTDVSRGSSSGNAFSSSESQLLPSSRPDGDYEIIYYDAVELLQDFLGFVPPLPLPPNGSFRNSLSETQLKILLGIVGLREQRANCPSVAIPTYIWDFLDGFNSPNAQFPRTSIWDLAPGNRLYLAVCSRLKILSILDGEVISSGAPEKLYLFNFGRNATVPWTLAVTNAVDALFVCRLDSRMNDYQIASHLLTRGIRFRTLVRDNLPPPRDLPTTFAPFRLSGYQFTSRDYDVYIRERNALIRNPRIARAALMKGGIVWRLIVAAISESDVLAGPTAAISLYNYGLALDEGNNRGQLWDDIISDEELDQICGRYFCYTGYGSQYGPKSWWPTFSFWAANAHTTYWTDYMEKKFQERLGEIASGKAVPRTAGEWRGWIRGSSHSRRITTNLENASLRFLRTYLDAGSGSRRD